jgi:ADP-heptose:LPS heptosyltransferase
VSSSSPRTTAPLSDPASGVTRIAVLRALPGLGDLLCAVPALRALRAAFPAAAVTHIGLPGTEWFADRFEAYLDGFEPLHSWPGLPETAGDAARAAAFVRRMQARRFDLALQLHGDGAVTNELVAAMGARRMAGLGRLGAPRPDRGTFPDGPDASEVERTLVPLRAIGVPTPDRRLAWPERPSDLADLPAVEAGGYAVVHPGASLPSRRWDPSGFALVADAVAARGLRVVLTGVGAEAAITRQVAAAATAPTVDVAGALSVGAAAALVRRARFVVTNDTGMSHLAAAVGTASVVVFTVTDPIRWRPEAPIHVAVRAGPDVAATASRIGVVLSGLVPPSAPATRRPPTPP